MNLHIVMLLDSEGMTVTAIGKTADKARANFLHLTQHPNLDFVDVAAFYERNGFQIVESEGMLA